MNTTEERQLSKNSIDLFILKFELVPDNEINFDLILNDISKHFDRTEKRLLTNFHLNFTTDKSEVNKIEGFDYVLTNEKERYTMTFSKNQNSFWFETSNYVNRETYSEIIKELLSSAEKNKIKITTKRIGMRFINNFNCSNIKQISKIFLPQISKNLAQRLSQENLSRIIYQEEFNYDFCKLRVQYGVPNKFYPAIINNFDLLLDIDAYDDKIQELEGLSETIINLNHCAYKAFVSKINTTFLNSLK